MSELTLTIICVCIPSLRPLFNRITGAPTSGFSGEGDPSGGTAGRLRDDPSRRSAGTASQFKGKDDLLDIDCEIGHVTEFGHSSQSIECIQEPSITFVPVAAESKLERT